MDIGKPGGNERDNILRILFHPIMKLVTAGINEQVKKRPELGLSYCLMLFPSTFSTSSASVVLNHNAADNFSGERRLTSKLVSGASCSVSIPTASSANKQRITCLTHIVQDAEK